MMITERLRARHWLSAALACALVAPVLVFAGTAEAQTPSTPTFTDPTNGAHLSLGTEDANSATAGFQYRIRGTAEPNADITVSSSRPEGESSELGTTTADDQGNWDLSVTFEEPGEWDLEATQTTAEGTSDPAGIKIFIVVRYVVAIYDDANAHRNWMVVSNPGDTTARAEVFVGGQKMGDTLTLEPGEFAAPRTPGLRDGPVLVDSLDGRPLVATERTLWRGNDLEETTAIYDGYLTNEWWFSWYDAKNSKGRDWIVVTNVGKSRTTVDVTAGGTALGSAAIDPGEWEAFKQDGLTAGPVHVTADDPVLATRRTLWKPRNFVELIGTPARFLGRSYEVPWYDTVNTDNRDWIMVVNPNDQTMTAQIQPPGDAAPREIEIGAGATSVERFPNTIGGPVFVDTDLPGLVTQRSLWFGSRSFEEVASIPDEEMSSTYWHTVYDDVNANADWFLQGSPFREGEQGAADVSYSISASCIDHSSTLVPGEVEFPRFRNQWCGGITVQSDDGPFVQTKRTLWSNRDFMEFLGIRGTALSGLATQVEAPGGVTVSNVPNDDGGNLDISWSAVDDPTVDGYWVYRVLSEDPLVEQRVAYTPQDACVTDGVTMETTCEARDFGLTAGEEVTYNVRALSLAIVEGVPGQGAGTPTDNAPSAPTWPEEGATTSGDEEVTLDWNDNPEIQKVVGYHVYFAEDPSQTEVSGCDALAAGDYTQDTSGSGVADSEHTVTGLTNGTRYCFQVTAQDGAGQESARSENRTGTPEAIPPQVTVTSPSGGEVFRGDGSSTFEITWTDEDPDGNKDFVQIFYSPDSGDPGTWVTITDFTDNDGSFIWDPPAIDSQTMVVRVRATDEKGNTNQDRSSGLFAIDSSPADVTVTSPGAGDQFAGGDDIEVDFDYTEQNPESMTVERSVDGGPFEAVTCDLEGELLAGSRSRSCTWVAGNITSENVVVRVTIDDEVGHSGSGTSEAFEIDSTAPGTPEITQVDGQSASPASGTDSSPRVVVGGNPSFSEDATVKIYAGPKPPSCDVDPTDPDDDWNGTGATTAVTGGDTQVVFNDDEANTDFTLVEPGRRSLWACVEDEVGNNSGISDEFVYNFEAA